MSTYVCVLVLCWAQQKLADSLAIAFHEVSAKTSIGVEEVFTAAVRMYLNAHRNPGQAKKTTQTKEQVKQPVSAEVPAARKSTSCLLL